MEGALAFDRGSVGSHRQLRGYEDLLSGTQRNLRLGQAFMFSKRARPGMNGPPCFASDRVVCQSSLAVGRGHKVLKASLCLAVFLAADFRTAKY